VFSDLVAMRELDMAVLKGHDPLEFWPDRMAVKEKVKLASVSLLKRSL
jgi:hypothetical protein